MSFRPSLLARWLSQPAELLRPTTKNTHSLLSTRAPWTVARSGSIVRHGGARASRRTVMTTTTMQSVLTRAWWRTRPNYSTQLPKQPLNRRFNSGAGSGGGSQAQKTEPASLSQRLRKLSREYGWAALGVYLLLSALDFPICFAAVRLLGVERIGHYEHVVVESTKDALQSVWPRKTDDAADKSVQEDAQGSLARADERNQSEEASIWTQLALAYAIHKSFIFIRVPLTAAVTPKVVKMLRRWGWDIGKRKPKRP